MRTQASVTCYVAGVSDISEVATEPETEFVRAVDRMLSRPDYLLPLVAAQAQYRAAHYGLTAAALLEDVFTDTVGFYVRQFEPSHVFERSPRGSREVDYFWDGCAISHKSGLGPSETSVLWDATVTRRDLWSSPYPIAYLSSGYSPTAGEAVFSDGFSVSLTHSWRSAGIPARRRHGVVVIRMQPSGHSEILLRGDLTEGRETIDDVFSFDELWRLVTQEAASGRPANTIEVLRTATMLHPEGDRRLQPGNSFDLTFRTRPGLHVLTLDTVTDVPLGANNRGQTLKSSIVERLLQQAHHKGRFAAMPLWYAHYAAPRPPDTFLALRGDFDRRFSAAARDRRPSPPDPPSDLLPFE